LTSQFQFDILATDFAYNYSAHQFADAYITQDIGGQDTPMGPPASYSTGVYIYNHNTDTELTTLPFPVSTLLRISTCSLSFFSTIYQNPTEPGEIKIAATLYPANPAALVSTFVSTLHSSMYIDTVSQTTYSTFCDVYGANGTRILSLLPRQDIGVTSIDTNIQDSIDIDGQYGIGLNVNMNPYITISTASNIVLSSTILYTHGSTLLATTPVTSDMYRRELLYTDGMYIHPSGYNFSGFDGTLLGTPNALYPDFTYDLLFDVNNGFRYATFVYISPQYTQPTLLQYLNVRIVNPNIVSTISEDYYTNHWFPNQPTVSFMMSSLQVRLQTKLYATYSDTSYKGLSTIWYDCLQHVNGNPAPACVAVQQIGNDVEYKVQIARHAYTRLCSVVRIGLSRDSGLYAGDFPNPITFDAIQTSYSDV
jgi:hypothetical protein